MEKKMRYNTLDLLRGVAVISMIAYHLLWDLVNIFDVNIPWFGSGSARIIQQSIRWAFILISGFSWHLGKKKLRRALIVLGASAVITLVTYVFMRDALILFGVLSLIGSAMLITIPLHKVYSKISPYLGIVVSSVLFALCYNVPRGYVGIGKNVFFELPDFLYGHTVTAYFGFAPEGFFSTDYVPLFPWIFLFWVGYFLFAVFEKHNLLRFLSKVSFKPLDYVGRHSLIIYMVHQPVVYGVLYIIFSWII